MALTAAHRGYEYQDLLTAIRLVDVLLGSISNTHVDEKLVPNDRFDDLTTVTEAGFRERIQIKHTESSDRVLSLATFTNDSRGLRLDYIIAAALADRDGPGSLAQEHAFRVILRDVMPTDEKLLSVLESPTVDPGPFSSGFTSVRIRFKADALWQAANSSGTESDLFNFLKKGDTSVERLDLEWVCERLVLELEAPAASLDLTTPNITEKLLLERVRNEVGAELYPNTDRSVIDVSAALINAARAARQGILTVNPTELLRLSQLRNDFGAVAQAHPVDHAIEISRTEAVAKLVEETILAADQGTSLLIEGPPGQGKSWICQQMIDELIKQEWLVVEHYCYLGDADTERLPRVLAESVFGSLLGRIADQIPGAVSNQRPRFAASEQALEGAITAALHENPNRRVALVIDGIDHVTRVQGGGNAFDPSFALADELAGLSLPAGSVLIVLSQPGKHLKPLKEGVTVPIPNFSNQELRQLSTRLGVIPTEVPDDYSVATQASILRDDSEIDEFVEALSARSMGNALYATYLCREALRTPSTIASPSETVRDLPQFDGKLQNYYNHIHTSLGPQGAWIADVIALLNFPVSRSELKEIRPDISHRVDQALEVMRPVLLERAAQGGVRVYHESFARFLRQPFSDDVVAKNALLERIIIWLEIKGMFEDSRAFRHLLPTLAEANRTQQVVDMVKHDFVVQSIAKGFPASAIINNLAIAVNCASRIGDWPKLVSYIEMSRSAETYQEERFETTIVKYVDVIGTLLGKNTIAERLLHDGIPTMSARQGIQLCAAIDALGAVAPWREYMIAYLRESENDKSSYGTSSDSDVQLAWLRGRLCLSSKKQGISSDSPKTAVSQEEHQLSSPLKWENLAKLLNDNRLPEAEVIRAILDHYGVAEINNLIEMIDNPGAFCLAFADELAADNIPGSHESAHDWALRSIDHGLPPGSVQHLIRIGVNVTEYLPWSIESSREQLLVLTNTVQERSIQFEVEPLIKWMDMCTIAARQDPLGLVAAEALLEGPGWYVCWLRFTIALTISENDLPEKQSDSSLQALLILTEVDNPFAGEPRACDLHYIDGIIDESIHRALSLLNDSDWEKALEVVSEVSNSIATTIDGEMGGPISQNSFLHLTIETVTPAREIAATAIINEAIANGGGGRYYSDLAEFRLIAARLALKVGNNADAYEQWVNACQLLTAYGWHKDTTIYELLDPFSTLSTTDPARARAGVSKLQPLCERVPLHTDGRETRHTRSRWWQLLALTDPCALAELTHSKLLSSCNSPNWLMHDARSELWRSWNHKADQVIAGALRLTLVETLDKCDVAALSALADQCDGTGLDGPSRLLGAVLTRIDERPYKYSVSNSDELLKGDHLLVEQLNLIAKRAGVPLVSTTAPSSEAATQGKGLTASENKLTTTILVEEAMNFRYGAAGIAQASRAWRRRAYQETHPDWSIDHFANILGYRIIELVKEDNEVDAKYALRLLADSVGFDDKYKLLHSLAEGLERYGFINLAVTAYVLTWTRARGRGGWTVFGGKNEIESLRRGTQLNKELSLKTIADEIDQIFSRGGGTHGITQALIYGFVKGGLGSTKSEAFDIWDEAFTIIAERAPRVAESDEPEVVYSPPVDDCGADVLGDINVAFAQATIAGIAHASKEQKRRTLLAIKFLIEMRPEVVSVALDTTLTEFSDPATLTWLLRVIELADNSTLVASACGNALTELTARPHLVVRTVARRLQNINCELPLAESSDPAKELLHGGIVELVLPDGVTKEHEDKTGSKGMVDAVAGDRLTVAEQILPGLRQAIYSKVKTAFNNEKHKLKMKRQIDAYADSIEKRWPDAYLAREEEIETVIQQSAAGARAAKFINGEAVNDPIKLEEALAQVLIDDSKLPFSKECTRQTRPEIPYPPPKGDLVWNRLYERAQGKSIAETNIEAACVVHKTIKGTVSIMGTQAVPVLEGGKFQGWRLVASVEKRVVTSSDSGNVNDDIIKNIKSIEIRQNGDTQALTLPPVSNGDPRMWDAQHIYNHSSSQDLHTQPIVGIDETVILEGLGIPSSVITPNPLLFTARSLMPEGYFVLGDTAGPAIALITWRTEYETSDYYLTWPRLQGTGLVMRNDSFEKLVQLTRGSLIFRDYIEGPENFGR